MKKVTSALALAALVGTPAAAMANVEFGGDFDARYFNVQGAGDQATGFDQRIRLQSSFEADGGVAVHTRLNLINDRWTGDGSGNAIDENPFSSRGHRTVQLDYGYVSMPMFGGTVNVGRQMASWNSNFTASDDRRDRIGYVLPLGGGHIFAPSYDRRVAANPTDRGTDRNQLNLALLGPLAQGVNYGLLLTNWETGSSPSGDALRGATLFAPYIAGEFGDFDYRVGGHYFGQSRGVAFSEDTLGVYAQGGFQLTPEFKIEGQALTLQDGALLAGGYDTYSSLIHNSSDHDRSATRIGALDLGGGGSEGEDGISRTLVATRGTFEMMDWTFMGSLGWVNYDDEDAGGLDEDVVFMDAQAHYQLTPSTTIFGTAGYADVEEDVFGRDNLFATSVNLNVQF